MILTKSIVLKVEVSYFISNYHQFASKLFGNFIKKGKLEIRKK